MAIQHDPADKFSIEILWKLQLDAVGQLCQADDMIIRYLRFILFYLHF